MIVSEKDIKTIVSYIRKFYYEFQNKEIVIFGCTPYVKVIIDALTEINTEVSLILDNNPNKAGQGRTCLGYITMTPDEYFLREHRDTRYIICSKYEKEMRAQLLNNGVTKNNIFTICVDEMIPTFLDTIDEFDNSYKEVMRGWNLYLDIVDNVGKDTLLLLCPYPGTGDVYMACSYLAGYIRTKKIEKYILIVVGINCKRVVDMFGYRTLTLTKCDMKLLLKAWEFYGDEIIYAKPLLHWGWRTKRFISSDHHPQITFKEMFLYDVYEFESSYNRTIPNQKNIENIIKFFENNHLCPGKTVLIAPYAGSFEFSITEYQWKMLSEGLRILNYSVCCNCAGDEKPIAGTVPVKIPYDEIINFVDYAGGFVGVRSGLCDILSTSTSKLVVLYENGFNASSIEYFGLKNMGLNSDAYELTVDQVNDRFIDDILEIFSVDKMNDKER